MGSENFRKRKSSIMSDMEDISNRLDRGLAETNRVKNVVKATPVILDDLDVQFCRATGLTKTDMLFLFMAAGLQICRQYLLTNFPSRMDDQTAARNAPGHIEEHSARNHRYYNPSLEEIITNPVPFDANIGADGALSGGGRMGHRVTAIGHDPVLGLIFGTANIATATLTTSSFKSYHIYTNDMNRDYFRNNASTLLVLSNTVDKLIAQGLDGKAKVAASLMKEIMHLRSDIYSKNSLPLPMVSAINPRLASELAAYGLDMANVITVGKQMTYSIFINSIIAMIHGLFYDSSTDMDRELYEVRTRKILSYSNLIASSTNLALVAITEDFSKLDLGGLAVTIYRLITDVKFIREVKREFIFGRYKDMIMGDYL